jgi:signal peptidase II
MPISARAVHARPFPLSPKARYGVVMNEALHARRRLGLIVALAILVADQLAKYLVTGPLGVDGHGKSLELLPFFNLTYVENNGVSLGLLSADSEAMRWMLVALTGLMSLGVMLWMWREKHRAEVTGLALVLGGALGNIVDRVRFGHVVDFADLHFGDFRPFLVFNIADAAIAIGALLFAIRALLPRGEARGALA